MKEKLIEAGYRLIPLHDRQKRPLHDKWGTNAYSVDDLGQQVGMVIETGMVDVDLDWPELRHLATNGTYETMAWGRKGQLTHLVYRADLKEPVTFRLPKVVGAPLLDGEHACQSASNRDPLSASKIDPLGAKLARRCVVFM